MNKDNKSQKYYGKKLKYGGLSIATTAIVIAIIVLLNVVVSMIMQRSPLKVDLTPNKLYEISKQTENYVKGIKQDVDIIVTVNEFDFRKDTYYSYVSAILDKYASYSDKVDVEYIDIIEEPDKIAKYTQLYGSDIPEGCILTYSNEKLRVNSVTELLEMAIDQSTYSYVPTGLNVEGVVTPNIMYVTDANPKKVAFYAPGLMSGTSYPIYYYAVSSFYTILASNAYDVVQVDLVTQELSAEEYDIAVIACPPADLPPAVISKIDSFLVNGNNMGKNVIYLANQLSQTTATPNIDAFLAQWGVKLGTGVIQESDQAKAQYVYLETGQNSASQPVGYIANENYVLSTSKPIIVPYSGPITLLFDETTAGMSGTYATTPILQTSDTTIAYWVDETDSDGTYTSDPASFTAASISTRSDYDSSQINKVSSNLLVMSPYLADNSLTSSNAYNNQEFLISVVNKLVGRDNTMVFTTKSLSNTEIKITSSEQKAIRNFFVFIVPLLVALVGVVVFMKRKNR
jgi:hypothetical protein